MEENVTQQVAEQTSGGVTLMDLWHVMTKYFWRILLLAIVFTLIEAAVSFFFIKTSYSATASVIMNPGLIDMDVSETDQSTHNSASYYTQIQQNYNYFTYASRLLPSISEFIKTNQKIKDDVKLKAADDANYPDVEALSKGSVSVSYKDDQLQMYVTYTTKTSPEAAKATVIALVESACEMSNTKQKGQNMYLWANTLHVDDLPQKVSQSNRWLLFVAIAFALFFVLAYLYYLIVTLTDDSIKSKHEIEDMTGFNVMAYIEDINPERVKKAKAQQAASGNKN